MKNYFSDDELKCKCGKCEFKFNEETREKLNKLRDYLGYAIIISSGYRCADYNRKIGATMTHSTGRAVDIAVSHKKAYKVIATAINLGFSGIGVNQKGSSRFIHLDDLEESEGRPRPHVWSY